ncbi:SDR family NAD(P)-dependent oxidoreductase [Tomitella biformata]|uniref:SDR family NAD(P)-dependent oxidoreductase n=1 Tax=Tomitella biformata TaxID=630403 RepID=UPI0004BA929B|nr:SDR family oxidoreductase [Tomitella biformata]
MSERLAGRSAVITGGGLGIGRGIAEAYVQAGANVLIAELNEEAGAKAATELREQYGANVEFVRTDVADRQQVQDMIATAVEHFGRLDVLVNNAWGGIPYARLEKTPEGSVRAGFEVGAMAAFWGMQAAFPELSKHGTGRVINIASLNGVNAHMYSVAYNMAKEALRTLTRTAAREWAEHQICCNIICPGAKSDAYNRMAAASPENAARMDAANPMGRLGDPLDDIGPVAVFLGGDDCRYLTGNTLFVDGGSHINGVQWAPNVD